MFRPPVPGSSTPPARRWGWTAGPLLILSVQLGLFGAPLGVVINGVV
ncbi:uncharacterized protein METZ01_LOCUS132565, partial [marine metagenome]